MIDTERTGSERIAYCQNCGRPLAAGEIRHVGTSVYCEPCLVTKIAAADAAGARPGYGASGAGFGTSYQGSGAAPPPASGAVPGGGGTPYAPGAPNPGLAALLGFIPGVGAFYNGQYAKGIVHLVVFAILTTLSNQNGIFGLFIAGWIFYQVIEAYHTARARRDGTLLPNPFGLNDIGERLGFGRAWPAGVPQGPGTAQQGGPGGSTGQAEAERNHGTASEAAQAPPAYGTVPPAPSGYAYPPPPQSPWGAPSESFRAATPPFLPEVPLVASSGWGSGLPMGAILLIGLGVLFLIGNSGFLRGFPIERLIPFLLIGFGVWLFVRKMMETGAGLADDGTPAYRLRVFRAARGPVWIVLTGVLFLLDSFHILSWGRSWPLYIILGGLVAFFERTAYTAAVPVGYAPSHTPVTPPMGGTEPVSPVPPSAMPTSSPERQKE